MSLRLLLFYFFVQQSLAIKHTKARVAQLCNFWNGFIFGRAIASLLHYGCPTGLVCPECHSDCLELRQNPSGFKLRDRRERGYQKKKNTSCFVGFNRWYSFQITFFQSRVSVIGWYKSLILIATYWLHLCLDKFHFGYNRSDHLCWVIFRWLVQILLPPKLFSKFCSFE